MRITIFTWLALEKPERNYFIYDMLMPNTSANIIKFTYVIYELQEEIVS